MHRRWPPALLKQREHPHLTARDPVQFAQRRAVKLQVEPVGIGEKEVRAEHEVESPAGKRQAGQRCGHIACGVGDEVAGKRLGRGTADSFVAAGIAVEIPDVAVRARHRVRAAALDLGHGKGGQRAPRPRVHRVSRDR